MSDFTVRVLAEGSADEALDLIADEAGPIWTAHRRLLGEAFRALWASRDDYKLAAAAEAQLADEANRTTGGQGFTVVERVTHGRHCFCSACAAQDWTDSRLAPCGMHGPSCPSRYAPYGSPTQAGQPDPHHTYKQGRDEGETGQWPQDWIQTIHRERAGATAQERARIVGLIEGKRMSELPSVVGLLERKAHNRALGSVLAAIKEADRE